MTDLTTALGLASGAAPAGEPQDLRQQVKLRLIASGLSATNGALHGLSGIQGILEQFQERGRLLADHRCPADQRIESFLRAYFEDTPLPWPLQLPSPTLVLDHHGLARELSLPEGRDDYAGRLLSSYRLKNGVLHNPRSDRRTTAGTFHVAEGGLPVPGDKKSVPKRVFAELFHRAVHPSAEMLALPFAEGHEPARTFVSLLLRPIVCPAVAGVCPARTMEIRFFAPGMLVSNLDFVESIFGNSGDPFLPRNDAGLDVEHWTGHTGCVILAPHLPTLTKKELGLPTFEEATERQRRDGMCWKKPDELYNEGGAFKITCRTTRGVIVTLIADNYYGYCKKEVKTQISYAANLYGNVEEEHAGGAIAYASYGFGDEYRSDSRKVNGRSFADVVRDYGAWMDVKPEGYAVDRLYPDLIYVPEEACASTIRQQVWWKTQNGGERAIPLEPGKIYITPSGFKLRMEKHPGAPSWRILGTRGEGTVCHKPCTVSGGGKSEISKSLVDYMLYGPIFVADVDADLKVVDQIMSRDYGDRWKAGGEIHPDYGRNPSRPILGRERSLGSVIKLLTPSDDYSDEYNEWLASIPSYIYPIVFIIKRFHRPEWGNDWRKYFSVDIVNGFPGHELKYGERKLVGTYLRVGLSAEGAWRTYKVRQDFVAAQKIQTEDDISASVTVPRSALYPKDTDGPATASPGSAISEKFVVNCEYRLFQRPDDAIHRGLDKQTEMDMSRIDNFISNYEPLTAADARSMVAQVTSFEHFTAPMRKLLRSAAADEAGYVVSSANPRLIDGKPSKNPRYLQIRPDLIDPMGKYVAEMGMRLFRALPASKPVLMPVQAVLIGRRNNPEEKSAGIRGLAVYNPIHYQELPELFMDFVCSLTGKSPSTTGAGSEGALTKAPFNAIRPTADLNAALVSFILTGLGGFSTSAGYVGPHFRMEHDISLLVPEIWCRLTPAEREPQFMIDNGYLEKLEDFDHAGERILASRLGYRITGRFVRTFFGRIFDNPAKVFDQSILAPETQDMMAYADGVKNITQTQQRVAQEYLSDGSIEDACPPLQALLKIMANGSVDGKDASHPEIRAMFMPDHLLASDWYRNRLAAKQRVDVALWTRHLAYLDAFLANNGHEQQAAQLGLAGRRDKSIAMLKEVSHPGYLQSLVGTLGTDPTLVG